jgi:fibronectin type III domain protein
MRAPFPVLIVSAAMFTMSVQAATFIVPDDRTLAAHSSAIVAATALTSYTEKSDAGSITTVTTMAIDEVIRETAKGSIPRDTIDVREPGGIYGNVVTVIPGSPRFKDGNRYLLFLFRERDRWHVLNLVLGKFTFVADGNGREMLLRDDAEIVGWDPDGKPHHESHRSAAEFLDYLRRLDRGGPLAENYFVEATPTPMSPRPRASVLAAFTATSYTFTVSGSMGARWNVFPNAVNFFTVGTEPGAPGNGITAVNVAFASWNGDPNSNVNYVNAGADNSGTHNGGTTVSDKQNTIAFERNLTSQGVDPFTCTSNSYSGTLGVGGVTKVSGTHAGPNNETFGTTLEGDVEMNQGIANCTLLFSNGDFNTAVTHEVGHTLGFRHSDQTRADDPSIACSTDASLECADVAVMKSFVPAGINGALQPWDQHAVAAVYPNSGGGTVPAAPTGVIATATSSTSVFVSWNASAGATSYEIYRKGAGGSFTLIGTSTTTSFTDTTAAANTAYVYRVRAKNASGTSGDSASDLATTVLFADDPLVARVTPIKAVHLAQLRTAVTAVRALAGLGAPAYTDPASHGVVIKAVHITELRTFLDQAMSILGLTTDSYTNTIAHGVIVRAVDFQELRNRVK